MRLCIGFALGYALRVRPQPRAAELRIVPLIRAGAKRANSNTPPGPYKISRPVTLDVERTTRNTLGQDAGTAPGTQLLDARTIRYTGKDFFEAWTRYSAR